jgi:glycosyltransferase involved in cell wall biosynthesis
MTFAVKKQGLVNKIISTYQTSRYSLVEPIKLKKVREKFENDYNLEKNPLISVYVPTYNRGPLVVERAITSVLAQTYKNFEFLVISDGSTDNTEELVKSIDDPRIRFINIKRNQKRYPCEGVHVENHWLAGPVIAANRALDLAKGTWIARIDDSVIWTPDHLEKLLKYAQESKSEFVTGACLEERFGKKEVVGGKELASEYFGLSNYLPKGVKGPRLGGTSTILYRSYLSEFKYNIDCWRKSWNRVNDIDLYVRMFKAGVRMGYLDEVVCDMPPRPGEKSLGWETFRLTIKDKEKHFAFDTNS